jgi:hypothetical protein
VTLWECYQCAGSGHCLSDSDASRHAVAILPLLHLAVFPVPTSSTMPDALHCVFRTKPWWRLFVEICCSVRCEHCWITVSHQKRCAARRSAGELLMMVQCGELCCQANMMLACCRPGVCPCRWRAVCLQKAATGASYCRCQSVRLHRLYMYAFLHIPLPLNRLVPVRVAIATVAHHVAFAVLQDWLNLGCGVLPRSSSKPPNGC